MGTARDMLVDRDALKKIDDILREAWETRAGEFSAFAIQMALVIEQIEGVLEEAGVSTANDVG